MRYRSRLEIISLVLQVANKGASKSRIMYGAYLSFGQTKEYIGLLTIRGFIAYDEIDREYRLTEKGLRLLAAAEEVEELIGHEPEEAERQQQQRSTRQQFAELV